MARLVRRAAAVGAAALALRAAWRTAAAVTDRRFMASDPAHESLHAVGSVRFRLPAHWHRTDGFAAYWAADLSAVRGLLPSAKLHPVRIDRDHGVIGVCGYRHFESTARAPDGRTIAMPAYGEVGVFVAVSRRPMPPFLPLLLQPLLDVSLSGGYVLHLPVTARFHRDGGRRLWGLPKFLADMEFGDEGPSRSVSLSEGGRSILELKVEGSGDAALVRAPSILYSILDGRLIEIRMASRSFAQVNLGAHAAMTLGDHPVSDDLRRLRLSQRPIASFVIQQQRFVMPAGRILGPARPHPWYEGGEGEYGRFVTRHADGTVVDHYAVGTGASVAAAPEPVPVIA